MARILLLNPNRWGRGITTTWIASHTATLKAKGHEVALFDAAFYKDWAQNETAFNTANQQYRPSSYEEMITMNDTPVVTALQKKINEFQPDVVFWSAISAHIHGEGEYAAIQFGNELMKDVNFSGITVCSGLQATAAPLETAQRFADVDYFISGESDFVIVEFLDALDASAPVENIPGLVYRSGTEVIIGSKQSIIPHLDAIGPYDYSLFDEQVFLRPYNGDVVRAIDYEMSRGCPFTCSYCVETVIQRYYNFESSTPRGALNDAKSYIRHKSAKRIFEELSDLHKNYGISLFRCQDTNFLTIDRKTLNDLADLLEESDLDIRLYIETRPEGITPKSVILLKRLKVDGVGMGIELATQEFRESSLNRFSNQEKIIAAFKQLRAAGIKRSAYNIIGLPDQTEESIIETIEFNQEIDPDNVTVAFFSPYIGTEQQRSSAGKDYFLDYEFDLDSQLRTMSRNSLISTSSLAFYKKNFVRLVREGIDSLDSLKSADGVN